MPDLISATDEMVKALTSYWRANAQAASGQNYIPELLIVDVDRDSQPKNSNQSFARMVIRHNAGNQRSFGGIGRRRFGQFGVVLVQVLALWQDGKGYTAAQRLAEVAKQALYRHRGSVVFTNVSVTEIGRDGNFLQVNVTANFQYDQFA